MLRQAAPGRRYNVVSRSIRYQGLTCDSNQSTAVLDSAARTAADIQQPPQKIVPTGLLRTL